MPRKKNVRSEDTKREVLNAAGQLFASKGYNAVTMRDIANKAGCSHTTIYIYFKDKEALLTELSMPPLMELNQSFEQLLQEDEEPRLTLKKMSLQFISFCLENRNMYKIFFEAKPVRVDEISPELEINRTRNQMFAQLMLAVGRATAFKEESERLLTCTRIYFYMLHGIVGTYQSSEETGEDLMSRLRDTFDEAFEILLLGFHTRIDQNKYL